MSSPSAKWRDLDGLIDLVLDDLHTPEDSRRLNEILRADLEACRHYVAYMKLHGRLTWGDGIKTDSEREIADLEISDPPLVVPSLSTTQYPLSTNFVGGPVFSYMVATLVLCVMLLGAWAYKITLDTPIATNDPTPSLIEQDASRCVARITGMKDCEWGEGEPGTIIGASVPIGRKYSLKSGLLQISYETGANVILEGPCEYKVDSSAGGYLGVGKLVAIVEKKVAGGQRLAASAKPQAANSRPPIPLFTVTTPTAVVTDLGTEFGVEVSPEAGTEVHVFRGKVEAKWLGSAGNEKTVRLNAGDGAGFDRHRAVVELFSARPGEFSHAAVLPRRPIDVAAKKTIVVCSGVFGLGDAWANSGRFSVRCVNNGITDESTQEGVYWLGRERMPNEYFIIDLWGRYEIERIELMNTHNSRGDDRGTKDFEIWAADEINGTSLVAPRLVLAGTLPCRFGAGENIPYDDFSVTADDFSRFRARYIKFVAKTYYHAGNYGGCGLNEIRVFAIPSETKGNSTTLLPAGDAPRDKEPDDVPRKSKGGRPMNGL